VIVVSQFLAASWSAREATCHRQTQGSLLYEVESKNVVNQGQRAGSQQANPNHQLTQIRFSPSTHLLPLPGHTGYSVAIAASPLPCGPLGDASLGSPIKTMCIEISVRNSAAPGAKSE
jgi:hypothetical protein